MPDGHGPAMPQVTAVDDQFGTHRVSSIPLLVSVYIFGNLLYYLMHYAHRRQTYNGDVYRVLAQKDS